MESDDILSYIRSSDIQPEYFKLYKHKRIYTGFIPTSNKTLNKYFKIALSVNRDTIKLSSILL